MALSEKLALEPKVYGPWFTWLWGVFECKQTSCRCFPLVTTDWQNRHSTHAITVCVTTLNNDFTPVRQWELCKSAGSQVNTPEPVVKVLSDGSNVFTTIASGSLIASASLSSVCMFKSFHHVAVTHEIIAALMHVTHNSCVQSVIDSVFTTITSGLRVLTLLFLHSAWVI